MYEQIREDTFYIMLYAVVTATALIASCYLPSQGARHGVTGMVGLEKRGTRLDASLFLNEDPCNS